MKINVQTKPPVTTAYPREQQGKLPEGLYHDADGSVVLVNLNGYAIGVIGNGAIDGEGAIAWPLIPAPAGTEVTLSV